MWGNCCLMMFNHNVLSFSWPWRPRSATNWSRLLSASWWTSSISSWGPTKVNNYLFLAKPVNLVWFFHQANCCHTKRDIWWTAVSLSSTYIMWWVPAHVSVLSICFFCRLPDCQHQQLSHLLHSSRTNQRQAFWRWQERRCQPLQNAGRFV